MKADRIKRSLAKHRRWNRSFLIVLALASLFLLWSGYQSYSELRSGLDNEERSCRVPWTTIGENKDVQICITSLTDAKTTSVFKKAARRDFTDILEATWPNKLNYSHKHNYLLINASSVLDTSRPPAWSKILAARGALDQGCDWVFWMDSDSLIMNSDTKIEDFLPSDPSIDLVITIDATGFNAGMWIIRNSQWSHEFLDFWWRMENFEREPGDTKSGDNDALKALLSREANFNGHVYVAPQCAFNSYIWNGKIKDWARYLYDPNHIRMGVYRKGDFLIHFAGIDNKMELVRQLEKEAS